MPTLATIWSGENMAFSRMIFGCLKSGAATFQTPKTLSCIAESCRAFDFEKAMAVKITVISSRISQ
jgi:hypothetical protein